MHTWCPCQGLKRLPWCGFMPIANLDEVTWPWRAYIYRVYARFQSLLPLYYLYINTATVCHWGTHPQWCEFNSYGILIRTSEPLAWPWFVSTNKCMCGLQPCEFWTYYNTGHTSKNWPDSCSLIHIIICAMATFSLCSNINTTRLSIRVWQRTVHLASYLAQGLVVCLLHVAQLKKAHKSMKIECSHSDFDYASARTRLAQISVLCKVKVHICTYMQNAPNNYIVVFRPTKMLGAYRL